MREVIQQVTVYGVALYAASLFFPGLTISGNFQTFAVVTVLLALGVAILNPVINVITFPIRFLSFGLIPVLTIATVLFILSNSYGSIQISAFTFQEKTLIGFTINEFYASLLLSYTIISGTIYGIKKILYWIFFLG